MIKIKILDVFANQHGKGVRIRLIGGRKESMMAYVDDIIMIEEKTMRKKFSLISFIRDLLR